MEQITKFLYGLAFIASLWACKGSGENTNNPTQDSIITTPTTTPTTELPTDSETSTLEGFWTIFKDAVAKKHIEKLKSLSDMTSIDNEYYGDMFFENFQAKVAVSSVNDLKPDISNTCGEGGFEFKVEDGESGNSLYIKKNARGNFEICSQVAFG